MGLEIDDRKFVKWILKQGEKVRKEVGISAVRETAKEIIEESKSRTPVATGDLRKSHKFTLDQKGSVSEAEIQVTDWKAAIVHEVLDKSHPSGEPKFLERSIRNNRNTLPQKAKEAYVKKIKGV